MMANFQEHLRFGWITHLVASGFMSVILLVLEYPLELTAAIVGITLPIALFASVLPDIDHHSSNTNSLFKYGLFITATVLTALTLGQYSLTIGLLWMSVTTVVSSFIIVLSICLFAILVGGSITKAFSVFRPVHRGLTHTISFAFFISVLLFGATWQVNQAVAGGVFELETALIVSLYMFLGICTHLKADGTLVPENILPSGGYNEKL